MTARKTGDVAATAQDRRGGRREALVLLGLAPLLPSAVRAQAAADPLPAWRDGLAKRALLDFVAAVSTEGGPGFVRAAERIAVFDNDGTLWAEQPAYTQLLFILDRVHPSVPTCRAVERRAQARSRRSHSGPGAPRRRAASWTARARRHARVVGRRMARKRAARRPDQPSGS